MTLRIDASTFSSWIGSFRGETKSTMTTTAVAVDMLQIVGTVIVGVAVPYTIYIWQDRYRNGRRSTPTRPWKLMPGWLPVLGHFHKIRSMENLVARLEQWCDEYVSETGCFDIDMAGTVYTVICREDRAREVLINRPAFVERGPVIRELTNSVGAQGVFSAEGEEWKREYKLMSAVLNRNNVKDFLEGFKLSARRLIQKWSSSISDTETETSIPVQNDLMHMTAETISRVALGRDMDLLNTPDSTIAYDIEKLFTRGFGRASSPIWYWRIPLIGQYLDVLGFSIDRTHKLLHSIVASAQDAGEDKGSLFLNKIYSLMKAETSYLQQDRLVGNILTLFIAGTDTTGKTLTNTLYLLAKDPACNQRSMVWIWDNVPWKTSSRRYHASNHFCTKSIVIIIVRNYSYIPRKRLIFVEPNYPKAPT